MAEHPGFAFFQDVSAHDRTDPPPPTSVWPPPRRFALSSSCLFEFGCVANGMGTYSYNSICSNDEMEITTDIESEINPVSRYYFPFSPNPLSRSVEGTIATDVINGQHNGSSTRGLEETTATETADSMFDGMYKYWLLLLLTILFEVAGTTSMKLSDGFKNILPSIMIYVFYGVSFAIFPLALKGIDLSVGYAIWSGLGTTLTALIGFYYFGDSMTITKIIALIAIIGGCVLLNFAGEGH